jgi:hypothetical protein
MSAKNSSEAEPTDLSTETALIRCGLIAQLVRTPPDKGDQERLLREIAARPGHIHRSTRKRVSAATLRRYLETHRDHGFDGMPVGGH